jgi:hypothetical protein
MRLPCGQKLISDIQIRIYSSASIAANSMLCAALQNVENIISEILVVGQFQNIYS